MLQILKNYSTFLKLWTKETFFKLFLFLFLNLNNNYIFAKKELFRIKRLIMVSTNGNYIFLLFKNLISIIFENEIN